MNVAEFIDTHAEAILAEWEAFAATRVSSAESMSGRALRDYAAQILRALSADLRLPQTATEQTAKSHGLAPVILDARHTAAEVHGALRAQGGFSMSQLMSEYRALRASVLRLWTTSAEFSYEGSRLEDVIRFNEAIDQAIAESVDYYSGEVERSRAERQAAERALTATHSRLDYAIRLSGVGFWYCDLPFDVLEWDERVKEHFFFEPTARITIEDFYDRIHPEDREPTRQAIEVSTRDHLPYDIAYRTVHPRTGELKWIRALGGTVYGTDGRPIHFDGVTIDVTAQKFSEQRLAESEARQRGVLANMDEAFTLFDQDFNILEINEPASRLVGLPRNELIGRNHWQRFPGTFDSDLGRMYRHVSAHGEPGYLEHRYEFPDGRRSWIEVRAFKVGVDLAVLFRDVTERREIIEALREGDRRKDEFLAMLAHELRNPLAPIRSAAEFLSRIPNSDAPTAAAAAIVKRQAAHIARLVEDLLDVARVTQGQIPLRKSTIDVANIITQAVETYESQLRDKHQRLTISTSGSRSLFVEGDNDRLVQCVGNVLSNAIKYAGPHSEIQITTHADEFRVSVEVADTGSGIAPELLPRIFDLFVQSQRTLDRAQGGLGVGLAVVKRLVEMHGGQVLARSAGEGLGSAFEIRLPRARAPASAVEIADAVKVPPCRVFVVDDNVDAADSLAMLLEMQGHTSMAVHSAREALERIESFQPDVMLIDIGLPDIDGYELVKRLRDRPQWRELRKVALTGYGQAEDKRRALEAGFHAHLVKPVDVPTLERALSGLL